MRMPSRLATLDGVTPLVADTFLALALTGVTVLLGHEYHGTGWRPIDTSGYVLICLANLPAAWRRRAPLPALVCCVAFWTVYIWAGYWPAMNGLGSMLTLYTLAAQRPPPGPLVGVVLVGAVWVYGELASQIGSLWSVIAQAIVFPALVWKFGDNARKLAERNDKLGSLTTQLRLEQADRARRAVVEERLRIARELHDVVAHHLSVVSVQAGLAGYVFASDPVTARSALDTITSTGREAQEELRRLLQVLRSDVERDEEYPPEHPASTLAQLDDLVRRVGAAGIPVHVAVSGEPRPLPAGLDLCAYRLIQESLTNVIKHAGSARVVVAIGYGPAELTVNVTDDGRGPADQWPTSGHGLLGMRERARLYGGTLLAGPRPEGGFTVTLTLPAQEPA
jgi:signal transduction histidine kinase